MRFKKLNKDTVLHYGSMVLGATVLSFGLFNIHSQSQITEGGILGAVWEIAECSKVGVELYADEIPVLECTKEVCKFANIDYLRLISSGTMVMTAFDGEKLVTKLKESGINAAVIGRVTDKGRYVTKNNKRVELVPQEKDEIYKVKF